MGVKKSKLVTLGDILFTDSKDFLLWTWGFSIYLEPVITSPRLNRTRVALSNVKRKSNPCLVVNSLYRAS